MLVLPIALCCDETSTVFLIYSVGGGICGDIDRKIEETDTLLFLCSSSSPALGPSTDELIQGEIKTIKAGNTHVMRRSESGTDLAKKGHPVNVLLCGFRVEWENDVKRFKNRLKVR